VQPQTHACGCRALCCGTPKNVEGRAPGDVPLRIAAEETVITGNLNNLHTRMVRELDLDDISRGREGESQNVETWPEIGNTGRGEDSESSFH
jgi:hypothetical protein